MSEIGLTGRLAGERPPASETHGVEARLRETCREVEGLFLGQLLAAMQQPTWGKGLFGASPAEMLFRSRHSQELAGELGRREALGLSEMLYRELAGQLKHGASEQARTSQPSDTTRVREDAY